LPVRIYTLAKELDVDSKVLVELCPRLGIHGKGSALASLTDDEVERIRGHLTRSAGPSAPLAGKASVLEPMAPVRTLEPPRSIRTLASPSRRRAASGTSAPAGPRPAEEAPPAPQGPVAQSPPAAAEPSAPAAAASPAAAAAPSEAPTADVGKDLSGVDLSRLTSPDRPSQPPETAESSPPAPQRPEPPAPMRPDLPSQVGRGGRIRPLTSRPVRRSGEARRGEEGESGRPSKPTGPVIRAAAPPKVKHPPLPQAPQEPEAQKPDIRLPLDAIQAGKRGSGALKEHVKQVEDKRRAELAKKLRLGSARPEPGAEGPETPGRGRGKGRAREDEEEVRGLLTRDARKQRRTPKRGRTRLGTEEEGEATGPRRIVVRRGPKHDTSAPRKGKIQVELPCTVRSFSEAVGIPAARIITALMQQGVMARITDTLENEQAELLALELGLDVEWKQPADAEAQLLSQFEHIEESPDELQPRPPIVTFLGHVDHGKTSLLDRIIGTHIVEGEAGGITQHIRAYRIEHQQQPIVFVDTPGHEAFTEMRARGANVTDIVVLVVAADDGVMPQTQEAISHAKAAGVPIVVALNKIDLPGVDTNRILQQLASNDLLPAEWGGDTEVVPTSALTGQGIDQLLQTILTIAELHEYRANPHGKCSGTCLEAERHETRGVVAKLLVQRGTLRPGDVIVCGCTYGRVKALYDTLVPQRRHDAAGPSTPVNVTGLDEVPNAGDRFYVVPDIAMAREIAQRRLERMREQALASTAARPHTLESFLSRLEQGPKVLNVILRADTRGSIEAIQKEFEKLRHDEVQIRVLQALVGGVTEADVHLADASEAVILAFNVVPDEGARTLAKQKGIEIRQYNIIYRVTEDIKAALEGMLAPQEQEQELGRALVKQTFTISKVGTVAGCQVLSGTIVRDGSVRVRVIRNQTIIGDYPLESLKREKSDAKEVRQGMECGIKLSGFNDIKEGDILDVYRIEEVARTL
jgi:translation initiation factor IF-2